MNYSLFYNYSLFGDVMMVVIKNEARPTATENFDDVTVLYNDKEIIGYNIFKLLDIVKIKSSGIIALPPNPLIDIINAKLSSHHLEPLPYKKESGFKVGKVLSMEEHPDSDHLQICQVDVGNKIYQVVCGAPNVRAGQKVVVATPQTTMPDGTQIVQGELRGVKSEAMLCSASELHLEDAPAVRGILVLEDNEKVGSDFFERK